MRNIRFNFEQPFVASACVLVALFSSMLVSTEIALANEPSKRSIGTDVTRNIRRAATRAGGPAAQYLNSGWDKYSKGDLEGAIKDATEAIALEPKNADAFLLRGAGKEGLMQYEAAILDYDQVVTLDPKHHEGYHGRGMCEFQLGGPKDEEAIEDLCKALRYSKNCDSLYNDLAWVNHSLAKHGTTIDYASEYIKRNPKAPWNRTYRAQAWKALGVKDKAIEDFKIAAEQFNASGNKEQEAKANAEAEALNKG